MERSNFLIFFELKIPYRERRSERKKKKYDKCLLLLAKSKYKTIWEIVKSREQIDENIKSLTDLVAFCLYYSIITIINLENLR